MGMGLGMAGRWEARTLPSQLSLSPSVDVSTETIGLMPAARLVKKSLRKSRASCRGRCRSGAQARRQRGSPPALPPSDLLTWSTLSRRGISETRRQHSGPPRLVVGATCSALMVSWGQRASSGCPRGLGSLPPPRAQPARHRRMLSPQLSPPEPQRSPKQAGACVRTRLCPAWTAGGGLYHVGVGATWHPLTRVQVQELVDLGGGEPVSDLKLLNNEHLAGQWPLL